MARIKDENDRSGYGVASDGTTATLNSFSDEEAVEITIPEMWNGVPLTKIAFGAFRGNENLIKVTLPDSVRTIEGSAFRACPNLETAVLSRGLDTIAGYAFASNPRLKTVYIPSTVMHMSDYAFAKCPNFTDLYVYDMKKKDAKAKRFVVAAINESRRISYLNSPLLYFDSYNMRKYDEGYGVLAEYEDRVNIAEYRLLDPQDLSNYMRDVYENQMRISIGRFIQADQVSRLTSCGILGLISEEKIDFYLELASSIQGNCLPYLLQYKEDHFSKHSFDFEL